MNRKNFSLLFNPFTRIAGMSALALGFASLVLSSLICWFSGMQCHSLLNFGGGPDLSPWQYLTQHIIIWLVPALLFYAGGLVCSKSRIRVIDVFGTVAFSQIPLLIVSLLSFTPSMQYLIHLPAVIDVQQLANDTEFLKAAAFSLLTVVFAVWMIVLMFNACKVSCNLRGGRLWAVYLIGLIVGNIVCSALIHAAS